MSDDRHANSPRWSIKHRALATETALTAARLVAAQAHTQALDCALCGGLAMQLYGFVRATQDVDFLASALLHVTPENTLSFGGISFKVLVDNDLVTVDWIVRDDFFRAFYDAALAEAEDLGEGLRLITPEWLAVLKYIAGRGKDQIDLLWLLQQPNLVNREELLAHFDRIMGSAAAAFPKREISRLFAQADADS